jgi:predicted DNA-binding transcriptional regulator AlpA
MAQFAEKEPLILFQGPPERFVLSREVSEKTGATQKTISEWPARFPAFPRAYRIGRLLKWRAGDLNKYFAENA